VAVGKPLGPEIRKDKIALGCPTNGVLDFLDIFYPQIVGGLGGN